MKKNLWLVRPMALAVSGCFGAAPVFANPTAPQVINGAVTIQGLGTSNLNVRNSPGSIIHWQGFSIGANEITRFTQQSASSAVLNRVVGADISRIQGQLLSNGRVFLINPAGIIIGAGGMIDTAGFVGSTLNMQNADFLAGKLKFQGDASSGGIVNQGYIKAGPGGNIILVAPNIHNSGVLQTEGGQLILAAGQKLTIGSVDLEGVQFEIQAPADSVVNIGKLLADGGAVGVFAGTLKHSGDIRANALVRDQAGRIVLKARDEVNIAEGSTITANGKSGGDILIQSAGGTARVAGEVTAQGSAGRGGDIKVLGDRVSLVDNAAVDASGASGGGQIRIGGDYQGRNPAIQNASRAFVGPSALLRADATQAGDGGRVIVWADKATQFYGNLSARGGAAGGNGGFAEVSGKENLVFSGAADLSAPRGRHGDLLLDPLDLFIAILGGSITSIIDEFADVAGNAVTITPDALASISGNVLLQAGRYMRFNDPVTLTKSGQHLTAIVDSWVPTNPTGTPLNRMDLAASITTTGGGVFLTAPTISTPAGLVSITTGGGAIALTSTTTPTGMEGAPVAGSISASLLSLDAGAGAITASGMGSVTLRNIIGGSFTSSIPNALSTQTITTTGPVSLTSATSTINTSTLMSGGGNVTANAQEQVSLGNVTTDGGGVFVTSTNSQILVPSSISAGSGNVTLMSNTGVFPNQQRTIDTTGNVTLSATNGNIRARVNNAASLSSTAARTNTSSVTNEIDSDTGVNAALVTATATSCSNSFDSCPSATVDINAVGGVNVGTVSASAPATTQNVATNRNSKSASVTIQTTGPGGHIRAMTGSSQITGTNVSLITAQGQGGGIGTVALPLNVSVERNLTFRPNGEFNVNLNGPMPNQVDVQLGVATAGAGSYTGTLNRPAGGLTLNASADTTSVTINNSAFAGFDDRVYNGDPFITLRAPNGALNIPAIVVPRGDMRPDDTAPEPDFFAASFNVTLSARDAINVTSYTRESAAGSLAKFTSISSDTSTATIGTLNGSRDSVFIDGPLGVTISPTSVTTEGDVSVTSTSGAINAGKITSGGFVTLSSNSPAAGTPSGNINVGEITSAGGVTINSSSFDLFGAVIPTASGNIAITKIESSGAVNATTRNGNITVADINTTLNGGTGSVTLNVSCAGSNTCGPFPAIVGPAASNPDFEVRTSMDPASGAGIFITGHTIGGAGFANPFDLQSRAITLTSFTQGGQIGFTGGIPLNADTPDLTINAAASNVFTGIAGATFHVDTGATALQNLTVTANAAVNADNQVRSQGYTYQFSGDGTNFSFEPATVPVAQFTGGGLLSFTATRGNINTAVNVNMAGGGLGLHALSGDVNAGATMFDGAGQFLFSAGTGAGCGRSCSVAVGDIGTLGPTGDITMTSGFKSFNSNAANGSPGLIRTGSINNAGNVTMNTFADFIRVGTNGTPKNIVSTGTVSLTAERASTNNSSTSGPIQIFGNISAANINLTTYNNSITAGAGGDLTATSGITLLSRSPISAGVLNAPGITVGPSGDSFGTNPNVTLGAISNVNNLSITGNDVNIVGAITADTAQSNNIFIHGATVSALPSMTLGAGSSATVEVTGETSPGVPAPLRFHTIDAGAGGTVRLSASGTIEQNAAGAGITAQNIEFITSGAITNSGGAAVPLDLQLLADPLNLTLQTTGIVNIDAHGNTLRTLIITKNEAGAPTADFTLANLGSGQVVTIANAPGNFTVRATSPTQPLDFTLRRGTFGQGITLGAGGIVTSGGPVLLDASGGPLALGADGIATSGGTVNLAAEGAIDGTGLGIRTGGPNGGGRVDVASTGGSIITGPINTTPTAAGMIGDSIFVTTSCASCGITVSGDLQTGTGGNAISVGVFQSGSITQTGGSRIISQFPGTVDGQTAVSVSTFDGNIGAPGARLIIDAPTVSLGARRPATPAIPGVGGDVFATLLNTTPSATTNLDLTAHNSFDVDGAAGKPFDVLSVATRGTLAGATLNLTAPGQQYEFARPGTDLFGIASPNTFEVKTARADPGVGGSAPPSIATFRTDDGHLLVRGGASLTSPTLNLQTTVGSRDPGTFAPLDGDLRLQGNDANPLNLTNVNQTFSAGRHLAIGVKATIIGSTQEISSTEGNSITITGGSLPGESVLIKADTRQHIFTPQGQGGSIVLQGGAGNNSTVIVRFDGVPNPGFQADESAEQQIEARGQIRILGGSGTGSSALVESNQKQLIRAIGSNAVAGEGAIQVTGGTGQNATARIVGTRNTGFQDQQVGEGRRFCCNFNAAYQTGSVFLQGGSETGSFAEINASGAQQIFTSSGTISLQGGGAPGTFAAIENASVNSQNIGDATFTNQILNLGGGGGTGAFSRIRAGGQQIVRGTSSTTLAAGAGGGSDVLIVATGPGQQNMQLGNLTMTGGTSAATTATAQLVASGRQSLSANTTRLTGGAGLNSIVRITGQAAQQGIFVTEQALSFGNLTMRGGTGQGASVLIEAVNADQRVDFTSIVMNNAATAIPANPAAATGAFTRIEALNGTQNLSGGNITLTAGGTAAAPVADVGATIRGRSQNVENAGTITINGGAGVAGSRSDAGFENLAGDHNINANRIIINGGAQNSRAGILNSGTGTQTVAGSAGITVTGNAVGADAAAGIQNLANTLQNVIANAGGISVNNTGNGLASISSAGTQTSTSRFIDVITSAGSTGNSEILATGNQWLRTTNGPTTPTIPPGGGSMRVAALGSGTARIETSARQLLEVDYPNFLQGAPALPGTLIVGNTAAAGKSLINGLDQSIFTRALTVQGGSGAGSSSKLTATNTQTISVLDGVTNILGGAGVNAVASIDPVLQTIVANGAFLVQGGTDAGAAASLLSGGPQTLYVTKGTAKVQSGIADSAAAAVQAAGDQVVWTADLLSVLGDLGANATAQIFTTSGMQTVNFGSLVVAAGASSAARVGSAGAQNLSGGDVTVTGNAANTTAFIHSAGDQTLGVRNITMSGGNNPNAIARIMSAGPQTLSFNTLTMNGGGASGAHTMLDSGATQILSGNGMTLIGGGTPGAPVANADAIISGHSQTISCASPCVLNLQGGTGTAGNTSDVMLQNLSGAQSISAGSILIQSGAQFSSTGIFNDGTTQSVTATTGPLTLRSSNNAQSSASVLIQNNPATAQTIKALLNDTTVDARGAGIAAITSAGSQSIDTRALDVVTSAGGGGLNGANATVSAAGDQTIHTSGALAAIPIGGGEVGVGVRVASRSSGTAKIQAGGAQVLNIGHPEIVQGRLLIGSLLAVNAADPANIAAGHSLVCATSALMLCDPTLGVLPSGGSPSQTVRAGSIYIQGPSGSDKISKLSGDGTQTITTFVGGISVVGGSGTNAFAMIDPTNQTITSLGDILLQGGTGPNADALINATGPQTISSQTGSIQLVPGSGLGADAFIATTSFQQSVSAPGGVLVSPGPVGGGVAGLQRGNDNGAFLLASNTITNEILRETENINDRIEEAASHDESGAQDQGGPGSGFRARTCN